MTFPRLSEKETTLLRILVGYGTLYGLELVAKSNGTILKGTLYTTLHRMQDKGLVTSRHEERPADATGMPRRFFTAADLGRRTLAALEAAARRLHD